MNRFWLDKETAQAYEVADLAFEEQMRSEKQERSKHAPLDMMDITRYVPLHQAHELGVRLSELYEAIQIVEGCGCSPELTEAVARLGERMRQVQADLMSACRDAIGE